MPKLGVSGLLIRDHTVLLGRRSPDDDALPNLWCTPGGGVEEGESTIDALVREFLEEVGIKVNVRDTWTCVCERMSSRGHTVLIFRKVETSAILQPRALDGFSAVRWFNWRQICELWGKGEITPMTYAALYDYEHKFPYSLNDCTP